MSANEQGEACIMYVLSLLRSPQHNAYGCLMILSQSHAHSIQSIKAILFIVFKRLMFN